MLFVPPGIPFMDPLPEAEAQNDPFIFSFGSYGSQLGQFLSPVSGFEIASNGLIYVPDGDERVQVFDSSGNFSFWFGDNTVSGMPLYNPADISIDGSNNIYVLSSYWGMVYKFDSSGNFIDIITSDPNGSSSGSTSKVAVDSSGNVYLAGMHDTNNLLVKIDAGVPIQCTYYNCVDYYDNAWPHSANSSTFQNIRDIEIDNSGYVYILDQNNVRKYTSSGNLSCSTSVSAGNVIVPDNAGNFYLLNWNYNKKYDSNCNFVSDVGTSGLADGQLDNPLDAKFDNSGNFYHFGSGESSKRIQKFSSFPPAPPSCSTCCN